MRVVLEFNEAFNHHDIPGMLELMSDDCVLEDPAPAPDGKTYAGKEIISQFWEGFFLKSPQAHKEIEEIFGLGLRCVMRWSYTQENADGTFDRLRGVDIFQLKEGAIKEQLSYVKGGYGYE